MALDTTVGGASTNSYASLDEALAYHGDRGNAAWANADDAARTVALIRAADYMQQVYPFAWQGERASSEQRLDWPRSSVRAFDVAVLDSIIPPGVKDAQCILALRALGGVELAPDLTARIKSQTVGPIKTDFDEYSPQSKRYLTVDRTVAPYLRQGNPYSARLERS